MGNDNQELQRQVGNIVTEVLRMNSLIIDVLGRMHRSIERSNDKTSSYFQELRDILTDDEGGMRKMLRDVEAMLNKAIKSSSQEDLEKKKLWWRLRNDTIKLILSNILTLVLTYLLVKYGLK